MKKHNEKHNVVQRSFPRLMLILPMLLGSLLINSFLFSQKGMTVDYTVEGKTYEGYYVAPQNNLPLVLLIHDWDGLTEYEIRRSDMLAELGYAVFAVDLFGKGIRPTENKDKQQHTGALYADRNLMRKILLASLKQAGREGADLSRTVAMGYCFGGAAVLELARSGEALRGFVTFHGGLSTPQGQDYANTKGEILVMHGTADSAITMKDFSQLAEELEKNNIPHEMISYGGAPHAFTVFGSPRYREDTDKKSWNTFIGFLKRVTQ